MGADCVYGGTLSYKWIRTLTAEGVPINAHVGLVPGKASWGGGYRAIGKTADEAVGVLLNTLELRSSRRRSKVLYDHSDQAERKAERKASLKPCVSR